MVRFEAAIEIIGVNPYVVVSANRAVRLKKGWRKPMPVRVKLNGIPDGWHRINMVPRGDGSFYLYLNEIIRKVSQTKVGDRVLVEAEFDNEYRSGPADPLPDWLDEALQSDVTAKSNWDALIPSRQKEVLRYLAGLKSEEAKRRNLNKLMQSLSGKPSRYMARDWKDGK